MKQPVSFQMPKASAQGQSFAFRGMDQFLDFKEQNRDFFSAAWNFQAYLGNQENPVRLGGLCSACNCASTFSATPRPNPAKTFPEFKMRWASLKCTKCGLSSTERRVFALLQDIKKSLIEAPEIFHVGQFSKLAQHLAKSEEVLIRSQYAEGVPPGHVDEAGIRYEDLTRLSFSDEIFDVIICLEILEHIPNYHAALHQIRRCLKQGATALLSFPWLGGSHYLNRQRARLLEDGSIEHLLSPSYHGDPANAEGILCFQDFGWQILDEIRDTGFSDVFVEFHFNPIYGYMTLSDPIVIAIK